eukprot:jgi/Botrbrau1/1731/Bobra.116_2s0073.1
MPIRRDPWCPLAQVLLDEVVMPQADNISTDHQAGLELPANRSKWGNKRNGLRKAKPGLSPGKQLRNASRLQTCSSFKDTPGEDYALSQKCCAVLPFLWEGLPTREEFIMPGGPAVAEGLAPPCSQCSLVSNGCGPTGQIRPDPLGQPPSSRGWRVFPDAEGGTCCCTSQLGCASTASPSQPMRLSIRAITYNMGARVPTALPRELLDLHRSAGDPSVADSCVRVEPGSPTPESRKPQGLSPASSSTTLDSTMTSSSSDAGVEQAGAGGPQGGSCGGSGPAGTKVCQGREPRPPLCKRVGGVHPYSVRLCEGAEEDIYGNNASFGKVVGAGVDSTSGPGQYPGERRGGHEGLPLGELPKSGCFTRGVEAGTQGTHEGIPPGVLPGSHCSEDPSEGLQAGGGFGSPLEGPGSPFRNLGSREGGASVSSEGGTRTGPGHACRGPDPGGDPSGACGTGAHLEGLPSSGDPGDPQEPQPRECYQGSPRERLGSLCGTENNSEEPAEVCHAGMPHQCPCKSRPISLEHRQEDGTVDAPPQGLCLASRLVSCQQSKGLPKDALRAHAEGGETPRLKAVHAVPQGGSAQRCLGDDPQCGPPVPGIVARCGPGAEGCSTPAAARGSLGTAERAQVPIFVHAGGGAVLWSDRQDPWQSAGVCGPDWEQKADGSFCHGKKDSGIQRTVATLEEDSEPAQGQGSTRRSPCGTDCQTACGTENGASRGSEHRVCGTQSSTTCGTENGARRGMGNGATESPATSNRPAGLPDVYVIGVQEARNLREWVVLLKKELAPQYIKVASESLLGMHICVFVRSGLRHLVTNVHTSNIAVGIGNVIGNKGAVAVAVKLGGSCRLLFVACHLAAHTQAVLQRNADYARIRAGLFSSRTPGYKGVSGWEPSGASFTAPQDSKPLSFRGFSSFGSSPSASGMTRTDSEASVAGLLGPEGEAESVPQAVPLLRRLFCNMRDITRHFDATIWMGDLNYRLEGKRGDVEQAACAGDLEALREVDQLKREMAEGRAFLGFEEGSLTFPPTFKYDTGADNYDTSSKQRVPAWTDRVLWRCNTCSPAGEPVLRQLQYDSVPQMRCSDHRPVFAEFELAFTPGESLKKQGKLRRRILGPLHRLRAAFCAVQ